MNKKIVGLTVSCLMVVALLLAACAPAAPKEKEVAPKEVAPPAEKAPTLRLPRVSIGETWQGTAYRVTISEVIVTDSYQYSSPTSGETVTKEAGPDKSFLIATVDIKNVDNITRLAGAGMIRALDSEGFNYAAMPYYGEEPLQFDRYLIVGAEMKGKVLFQIRKGASGLRIKFYDLVEFEIK